MSRKTLLPSDRPLALQRRGRFFMRGIGKTDLLGNFFTKSRGNALCPPIVAAVLADADASCLLLEPLFLRGEDFCQ